MKKYPKIYTLKQFSDTLNAHKRVEINGKWYPARPSGLQSLYYRLKAAYLVFTGQADAIIWPQDEIRNQH